MMFPRENRRSNKNTLMPEVIKKLLVFSAKISEKVTKQAGNKVTKNKTKIKGLLGSSI